MSKINAISLFSSAGIGELLIPTDKINVIVANEIIKKRADCYSHFFPNVKMICGDITEQNVKDELQSFIDENNIKFLIATPPCQGFSTLGKNKVEEQFLQDRRNFLVLEVLDIIDKNNFDYILMENVPRFVDMYFPHNDTFYKFNDIIEEKYSDLYNVDIKQINAEDYGVPQSRPRVIIRLWKKDKKWAWLLKERKITLLEAIGHLPSLESGEKSNIPWHYAKIENPRTVLAMQHTATGCSALKNEFFYPKKEDGTRIKGFHNTFKRLSWDKPCPARTTYSGSMSSHNNVHPGRKRGDGTYSDARVLTLLETFIVSTIPSAITFPKNTSDTFIRTVIGESVPPLLIKKIIDCIEN